MELFRISKAKYAKQLSSSGSANRWNKKGQNVIYAGSSRSLSSLELLVHRAFIRPNDAYSVMVISLADESRLVRNIEIEDLPLEWRHMEAYDQLQEIGSEWYLRKEALALRVPSAVIPREYNFVLNTEHPDFQANVQLVRNEPYLWDERLVY